MSVLEIERGDGIMVLRLNRPERLNALNPELRGALAEAWTEFRDSRDLEIAIAKCFARECEVFARRREGRAGVEHREHDREHDDSGARD